ncbi:CYT2 [Sanghuangporus sanghuang]
MQILSTLILISALAAGLVEATPTKTTPLVARGGDSKGTKTSKDCSKKEFFWETRSCCLPSGGPTKTATPPSGIDCPSSWYFSHDQGCCVPKVKPTNSATPTCSKKGWLWISSLQCCSQSSSSSSSTSTPSSKPKSKKDHDKKDHGKDFVKKDWGNEYKEKKSYDKVKRSFEQWDASFCPTGLTTCPIISNGVFTGDSECVDTLSDLTSCGGCASLGQGTDCSPTPGASCLGGVCVGPRSAHQSACKKAMAQCPVDHSSSSSCSSDSQPVPKPRSGNDKCPVDHSQFSRAAEADKCPVDHKTRSTWTGLSGLFASSSSTSNESTSTSSGVGTSPTTNAIAPPSLPTARQVSSIPRSDSSDSTDSTEQKNWVYPSEAQFFAAMARKNHTPRTADMRVIVPIHNAVNERCWGEVMSWERGWGGERCGGVKLVSFKGRPGERTPKAWVKSLLGYQAPFDRHDWVIDRCGSRMRYVIDFYTGKSSTPGNLSFYLDVRPALDNWDAVKMRSLRFLERWVGPLPWTNAAATNDSGGAKTTK